LKTNVRINFFVWIGSIYNKKHFFQKFSAKIFLKS
jgi:hypothetical protein